MARTLFDKYGGFAEIRKIVSAFYDEVLDDDLLQRHFTRVNMRTLIDHQTKMISSLLGGPAYLSNDDLARAHRRMAITDQDYDRLCSIMAETLEDAGFEDPDRDAVIRQIEGKRSFVVGD